LVVNPGGTSLTASPSPLAFGTVAKTSFPTKSVAVTNTGLSGATGLTATGGAQTGTGGGFFTVNGGSCPASLAAGASCTIGVQFDPGCTAGAKNSSLSITGTNFPAISVPLTASTSSTGLCP
jgi:hypothetical protein